jgi:hypothetical protein
LVDELGIEMFLVFVHQKVPEQHFQQYLQCPNMRNRWNIFDYIHISRNVRVRCIEKNDFLSEENQIITPFN